MSEAERGSQSLVQVSIEDAEVIDSSTKKPGDVVSGCGSSGGSTGQNAAIDDGSYGSTNDSASTDTSTISGLVLRMIGRVSIASVAIVSQILVAACTVVVVLLISLTLVDAKLQNVTNGFGDAAMLRVQTVISRHFAEVRSVAAFASVAANQEDLLKEFPCASRAVELLGQMILELRLIVLIMTNSSYGYAIAASSAQDPSNFPYRSGRMVVEAMNASSNVTMVAYYDGTDGRIVARPNINDSISMHDSIASPSPYLSCLTRSCTLAALSNATFFNTLNRTFNISKRPYGPLFLSKFAWSDGYVSVSTATSAVGLGGPYYDPSIGVGSPTPPAATVSPPLGSISVHDYTTILVAALTALVFTPNGQVILLDRKTLSFIGGNINNPRTQTLVNGTVITVTADDIQSALFEPIWETSKYTVLACTDRLTTFTSESDMCSWTYTRSRGLQSTSYTASLSVLFEDSTFVRASVFRDPFGLNLMALVLIPSGDFNHKFRVGLQNGIVIAACVTVGLVIVAALLVWAALIPMREAEAEIQGMLHLMVKGMSSVAPGSTSGAGGTSELSYLAHRAYEHVLRRKRRRHESRWLRSLRQVWDVVELTCAAYLPKFSCREAVQIQVAITRLQRELVVMRSFLPEVTHMHPSSPACHSVSVEASDGTSIQPVPQSPPPLQQVQLIRSDGMMPSLDVDSATRCVPEDSLIERPVGAPHPPETLVTFVVCDAQGFHKLQEQLLPTMLQELHAKFLAQVQMGVAEHQGVVSNMFGDRVMIHFNAERRVRRHATCAVQAMLKINDLLRVAELPPARLGASTSKAHCHVSQAAGLRVLHVIGNCVLQAFALSQQAKMDRVPFLCSWRMMQLIGQPEGLLVRHMRLAILPYEPRSSIVSTLLRRHDIAMVRVVDRRTKTLLARSEDIEQAIVVSNAAMEAASHDKLHIAAEILTASVWGPDDNWLASKLYAKRNPPPSNVSSSHSNGPVLKQPPYSV